MPSDLYPGQIHALDCDKDGKPDLVVANAGKDHFTVYHNHGGLFDGPISVLSGGANCRSVAVLDINRDGKPDSVTQNADSHTIGVLINDSGL